MIWAIVIILGQSAGGAGSNVQTPAELVKQIDTTTGVRERDKPFEVAASLGRLYMSQGRYAEARDFFAQAVAKAEPVRAFYIQHKRLAEKKALLDPGALGCAAAADATMDQLFLRAKEKAKSKSDADAMVCSREALLPLREVEVLLGNCYFLLQQANEALATYERSISTFDDNAEARYARGALLLDMRGDDLSALKQAQSDLNLVVKTNALPKSRVDQAQRLLDRSVQAIAAGGMSKIAAPKVVNAPVLSEQMIAAVQNTPRTQDMESKFETLIVEAEDHLAHARFQQALDNFKQVMPYQPDNKRLRAGMAWTMIKLNRQPMADNVWRVAAESPQSIVELGDRLKSKGDSEGAKAIWQRLKDTVPGAAGQLQGRL